MHTCGSPVSFTCISSLPTESMRSHSPPRLLLSFPSLLPQLRGFSPPSLHISSPFSLSIHLPPTIFPFPTPRPVSLFIQARPPIPSSTRLSIRPVPQTLCPNPAEGHVQFIRPLPCLRAPAVSLLFPPRSRSLGLLERAKKKEGQKEAGKWRGTVST